MRFLHTAIKCPPGANVANVLALAVIVLLPLYMPNGYIDLTDAKFKLLVVLAVVGLVAVLIDWRVGNKKSGKRHFQRPSPTWLPLPVLCLSYTIAFFLAQDKELAFWGLPARKNGLVLLLACTVIYFVVFLFSGGIPSAWFGRALAVVGCGITLLCWLNYFMVDPLDVYYSFLPGKGNLFLGTVGNMNFYGALVDLCLPIAVWEMMMAVERRAMILWGAVCICLGSGLIVAGSDAAWLAALCALFLLGSQRAICSRQLARLLAAASGWSLAALLAGILARRFPVRDTFRTTSEFVTRPGTAIALMILFFMGTILLFRQPGARTWRYVRWIAAILVVGGAVVCAAANLTTVPLGRWENILRFSDQWGSNRGFAWKRLWTVYHDDISFVQKLFGLGGDAVNQRLNIDDYSVKYMILLNGEVFDSAHNEYLQHLLCGGAVGLAGWLSFLFLHVRCGLKNSPGLAAAIAAYAIQAFFSISMPGVFPIVFVLAALCLRPQPLEARGQTRCVIGLALVAPPLMWIAAQI